MKLQRNKRVITLFYVMLVIIVPIVSSGCTNTSRKKVSTKEQQVSGDLVQEYYQEFEKYGFAIKTPCELKDVSSQSTGDFLLNYGGVTNQDDSKKMAAYQLIVSRVPVGYKDYSKSDYEVIVNEVIKNKIAHFTSSKPIRFGYEGYVGYEGTTSVGGYKQKGVIFAKDNLIIALTLITNNRLQSKFNKFTNGFKVLSSKTYDEPLAKSSRKKAAIPLAFGYSVDAPCRLSATSIAGMDYAYSGAINGNDKDRAVIYKVQANELPQAYSSMLDSDKRTIKSNLLNYLEQRGRYTQASVNVEAHLAYNVDFMEQGFKCKECLILTDSHVIELIMFSKKDISTDFSSFVNSLNKQEDNLTQIDTAYSSDSRAYSEEPVIEQTITPAKTVRVLKSFKVPSVWLKYLIDNSAFSIAVPPTVEMRKEYHPYTKVLKKVQFCNSDVVVFQQKDLSSLSEEAYKHYCRIMIQHTKGNYNEFLRSNETQLIDSDIQNQFAEIVTAELGQNRLIGFPEYNWIDINGTKAVELKYRRTGVDNNTTACTIYMMFNDNEMVKMVTAYREQEKEMWMPDIENVIRTFKWVK